MNVTPSPDKGVLKRKAGKYSPWTKSDILPIFVWPVNEEFF